MNAWHVTLYDDASNELLTHRGSTGDVHTQADCFFRTIAAAAESLRTAEGVLEGDGGLVVRVSVRVDPFRREGGA